MALYTTQDDHRRDGFVFFLLVAITQNGEFYFDIRRLHAILPFYIAFLKVFGVSDLGFYRDIVSGMYPELDKCIGMWRFDMGALKSGNGYVYELQLTPRAIKKLQETELLTEDERRAARKASLLVQPLVNQTLTFEEVLRETGFVHN